MSHVECVVREGKEFPSNFKSAGKESVYTKSAIGRKMIRSVYTKAWAGFSPGWAGAGRELVTDVSLPSGAVSTVEAFPSYARI